MLRLRYGIVLIVVLLAAVSCSKQRDRVLQGYIEGRYTYLAAYTAGYLQGLQVQRGDRVVAEQKLFYLNPNPELAELKQAQSELAQAQQILIDKIKGQRATILESITAQLKKAKAELILAKENLSRDSRLYKAAAISRAKYDRTLAEYRSAFQVVNEQAANLAEAKLGSRENEIKAQRDLVKAMMAKVERLQWIVDQKSIKAPAPGRIFDTFFRVGEMIPAGQAVVALLQDDQIKLIFYVPERLLGRTRVGQTLQFTCDECERKITAKVDYIAPQAEYTPPVIYTREERAKLVYRVEAAIKPAVAATLNPGQPVQVFWEPAPI